MRSAMRLPWAIAPVSQGPTRRVSLPTTAPFEQVMPVHRSLFVAIATVVGLVARLYRDIGSRDRRHRPPRSRPVREPGRRRPTIDRAECARRVIGWVVAEPRPSECATRQLRARRDGRPEGPERASRVGRLREVFTAALERTARVGHRAARSPGSGYDWYRIDPFGEFDPDVRLHPDPPPEGWVAAASKDGDPWIEDANLPCPPTPMQAHVMRSARTRV